jgi:putative ABC transport system permease protein
MIRNYIIVSFRNLIRHRVYTLINVFGLSLGMTACFLVGLYVQHQAGYDRHHENGDRIYRVLRETTSPEGDIRVDESTSGLLGPTMMDEFAEVESAVRIGDGGIQINHNGETIREWMNVIDRAAFDVFTIPLVRGNPETVFASPFSIVLSKSAANRLFPDADPIGQTLEIRSRYFEGVYTVTGVLEYQPQTAFGFDYLTATISGPELTRLWNEWQTHYPGRPAETWVMLRSVEDAEQLRQKLDGFLERHLGEELSKTNRYLLQPLDRAWLYSYADYGMWSGGSIDQLYLFSGIALMLLLIGAVNFVNLSTARSSLRAREIGVRRVVGSYRSQLIGQFMGEAVAVALLSGAVALGLAELSIPYFNAFIDEHLRFSAGGTSFFTGVLAFTLLVGVLSGLYPALQLSRTQPLVVLKGTESAPGSRRLRQGLVLVQFAISIALIASTDIADRQLRFLSERRLGFATDRVMMVYVFAKEINRNTNTDLETWLAVRYPEVKEAFSNHPNVIDVSAVRYDIGAGRHMIRVLQFEGQEERKWNWPVQEIDEDYLSFFDIDLKVGRNVRPGDFYKNNFAYLLNETAVRSLGWTNDEAIGKRVNWFGAKSSKDGHVIGVIADYHHESLYAKIEPIALIHRHYLFSSVAIRLGPGPIDETMPFLEETWKRFVPHLPMDYEFLDDRLARMYEGERNFKKIVSLFSGLGMALACVGLLGLTSFTVQRRMKEIGIRKVLGASPMTLVKLLSAEFVSLVLIANVVAIPSVLWFLEDWLGTFAYRIELGPEPFLYAGIVAMVIVCATMSGQTIRATRVDPVETLRDE